MPKSVKFQMVVFLAAFGIFLGLSGENPLFLKVLAVSVSAAVMTEAIVYYIKSRRLAVSGSPVISGLIVGFVFGGGQPLWVPAAASMLAVISKYAIRFRGRHIFNPAAFGICAAILLFGAGTQWMGTYAWYILLPAGFYFVWRVRKAELLAGYFLSALVLFGTKSLIQHTPLPAIFGYLSYFYIFVMLIEPKTTPVTGYGKAIFGVCNGALIFILTERGLRFDVELLSLLACNTFVPVLNRIK